MRMRILYSSTELYQKLQRHLLSCSGGRARVGRTLSSYALLAVHAIAIKGMRILQICWLIVSIGRQIGSYVYSLLF